jgi:hypothetical protein
MPPPLESCDLKVTCPPTDLSCFKLDRRGADRMPTNWTHCAPECIKVAPQDWLNVTLRGSLRQFCARNIQVRHSVG